MTVQCYSKLTAALALTLSLAACGGEESSPPPVSQPTQPIAPSPTPTPTPTPTPPATGAVDLTQDRLLSDAELRTAAINPEPSIRPEFRDWVNQNAQPIRSITFDEDFSDLQFLRGVIGDRSVVQLGESSHGTREFNHIKVRLIKFLHQEMGFNRVAFESGFFDGFHVDRNRSFFTPRQMQDFIFLVWSTEEVLELFEYARQTQGSDNPLRFSGFDSQISSAYFGEVFGFISELPETPTLTPVLKNSITTELGRFQVLSREFSSNQCFSSTTAACNGLIVEARDVQESLQIDLGRLGPFETLPTQNVKALHIAILAASLQIDNLIAIYEQDIVGDVRDESMADLFVLARDTFYPGEKTVIWAHNRHVALEQSETIPLTENVVYADVPMGFHLREALGDDLFTIGLYMLRGQTADNFRNPVNVVSPLPDSLEAIGYSARLAALYLDTSSSQPRTAGNAFAFERISAHYWGGAFGTYTIVPSDQFDGVIFIDNSSVPAYRG